MSITRDERTLINKCIKIDQLELARQNIENKIGNDLLANELSGDDFSSFDKLIPMNEAKAMGVYFTPSKLASEMASDLNKLKKLKKNSVIIDPTCGCGALLLAVAEYLPLGEDLVDTLTIWGKILHGIDLNDSFIDITKIIIINEARKKTMDLQYYDLFYLKSLLPNIVQGDFFEKTELLKKATHIISNPPYHKIKLDSKRNSVYGGSVNIAAIITYEMLTKLNKAAFNILLPEVLRVGTRYEKWRSSISSFCSAKVIVHGDFGPSADVDVFSLQGNILLKKNEITWKKTKARINTVKDNFLVHVGCFVPHRDLQEGDYACYIHARNIKDFSIVEHVTEKIKTKKKLVKPPFVVIKRTSSPSDKKRARAAIINTKSPVLVENHLITLSPINGELEECKNLLKVLFSEEIDCFLNENIRCRHLTVGIIKDIPYSKKEDK